MSAKLTCVHFDHKFNENSCLDWDLQFEDDILTILSNPLHELYIIFWMYMSWQLVSYWCRQTPAKPANQHLKLESLEHETHWSWKRGREIFTLMKELDSKILPQKTPLHTLGQAAASLDPSSPHLTYQKQNPMVEETKTDPSMSPLLQILPSSTTKNCW